MWSGLQNRRVQMAAAVALPAAVIALVLAGRVPEVLPRAGAQPAAVSLATPTPVLVAALPARSPTAAAALKVYVSGAVRAPGVYSLAPGDRVEDALRLAGGPEEDADLTRLNLAQRVRDEQQIHVPRQRDPIQPVPAGAGPADDAGTIDLTTATLAQLDALPGVGPVTARRILDYRAQHGPFAQVEDLRTLKLVTQATYEKIKDKLVVR